MKGFKKRDVWTVVERQEMTESIIVMGGRFVLCLDNAETSAEKAKAQFAVRGYDVEDKAIVVHDTAVLRSSPICMILSAAAQHKFGFFFDVSQAYLQSK